jgi:hypothetical protein
MDTKTKNIKPKGTRLNWKPVHEVKTIDLFSVHVTRKIVSSETLKKKKELFSTQDTTIIQ